MKKLFLLTTALMIAFLSFNPLNVSGSQMAEALDLRLIDSSDNGISLELRINWQSLLLEKEIVDGKTYLKPSLPGASQGSQAGSPDLPVVQATLGIPFGVDVEITVTPGIAHEKSLVAPILPVETEVTTRQFSPDHQRVQDAYSTQSSIVEDAAVYESTTPFPEKQVVIGQDAVVRQQRIIGVQLYPLQYQPLAKKLIVYESLLVNIRFADSISKESQTEVRVESEVYETFFRASLLNYESEKNWRSSQAAQRSVSAESIETAWLPPEPSWRVQVRQDGMYRMTYEELETAGLPVATLDPSTFQMYYLGSEIAIVVNSATENQFIPGDSLVFYGEKIESKYSQDNVYWLTFGHAPGLRMEEVNGTPNANPNAEQYLQVLRNEENISYINYIPSEEDFEHFMGKYIYPQHPDYRTITIPFEVNNLFDGSGIIKLALLGYLDVAHQASISLNGTLLPDSITWNGIEMKNAEINLPAGSLVEGINTIIISTTNAQDLFYLDWVELVYPRAIVSENDHLLFDYVLVGGWNFNISGFSTNDLSLFDVSNPSLGKQIVGFSMEPTAGTFTLQFAAQVVEPKMFWSGSGASYLAVESIIADVPSDWGSLTNGADYLVITHEAFYDQAVELADFRASQGLRAQVVDVQDVYDEFGYGITGPQPIRSFLSFAYANWVSPAPSYVVLLGDGHFDPNNYMGFGRQSFIPPYLASVDPELGETAADNRYVAFIGEDVFPDMLLGRLAVNTTADAQGFVDKIIAYEESPERDDWNERILAVSDSYESGWPFPFLSDDLLRCCLPKLIEPVRVYLGVTHPDVASAKQAVLEEINAGKLLVNFIGHAAASMWAAPYPGILSVLDVSSLNNLNRYPVILSMTCWDGYYVYPNPTGGFYEAMAEVFTKPANKGAVASWSATGMGVTRGHDYLSQGFFNAVFRDGLANLGQATSYGKLYLWTSRENLDLMDTYLLFGDPATNINMPLRDLFLPLISN